MSSFLLSAETHSWRECELAGEIASNVGGLAHILSYDATDSQSTGAAREASESTASSGGLLEAVSSPILGVKWLGLITISHTKGTRSMNYS
jgi:hypothetical protein